MKGKSVISWQRMYSMDTEARGCTVMFHRETRITGYIRTGLGRYKVYVVKWDTACGTVNEGHIPELEAGPVSEAAAKRLYCMLQGGCRGFDEIAGLLKDSSLLQ